SAVHDGNPEILEVEKRRNLEKKQHLTSTTHEEHAPGWNEYLASASEAHIKADRHGQDGPPTIELTERTIKHVKDRHNGEERIHSSREEASYERDEVLGPLKNSSAGTVEELTHEDKKRNKHETTLSEEAVKADRGEVA
ncbi:hypothetical protein K439DRAFT_1380993, partial [Ramaria rubella]